MYRVEGADMNFSFAFSVLIRRGDDRSGFIVAYSKIPRNRGVEIGYGKWRDGIGDGVRARHIPAAHRKTRFSQAWQPSRCICRFYDKRKVGGGGQSCWRKIGARQSPPPSLPAYLTAIKLREQTDSIERTAYASRSRNNWELPVIPSTDPIGIGGGGG